MNRRKLLAIGSLSLIFLMWFGAVGNVRAQTSTSTTKATTLLQDVGMSFEFIPPAAASVATVGSIDVPMKVTVVDNTTLTGLDSKSVNDVENADLDDLNTSSGIRYSSSIGPLISFVDPTSNTVSAVAQQVGLVDENEIADFAVDMDRTVVSYEPSISMQDVQKQMAVNKGIAKPTDLNITKAYLRVTFDQGLLYELFDKITSDDRFDQVNQAPAENKQLLKAIINDYIFDYTHGLMLSHFNDTALPGEAGVKLSDEYVGTLGNKTDHQLDAHYGDTSFLTYALMGYIMQNDYATKASAGMVARGLTYGVLAENEDSVFPKLAFRVDEGNVLVDTFVNVASLFPAIINATSDWAEGHSIGLLSTTLKKVAEVVNEGYNSGLAGAVVLISFLLTGVAFYLLVVFQKEGRSKKKWSLSSSDLFGGNNTTKTLVAFILSFIIWVVLVVAGLALAGMFA